MTPWDEIFSKMTQSGTILPSPTTPEEKKPFDMGEFMKGDMAKGMMVALSSGLLGQPKKEKVVAPAWGNQGSARPYKPMFQGSQGGDFKSILAMLMRGR